MSETPADAVAVHRRRGKAHRPDQRYEAHLHDRLWDGLVHCGYVIRRATLTPIADVPAEDRCRICWPPAHDQLPFDQRTGKP